MKESFAIDFIGIGAARSGTTWMAKVLQSHKDICISKPKELDFFSKRTLFLPTSNNEMSMDWYESKFFHCKSGQLKGEFSPSYLVDKDAPRLIRESFPNTKLILSLRNPTEALISHYQNVCVFHPMKWTFEEFLMHRPDFLQYYQYAPYLQNYLQYFDAKNIHIILYDDIVTDPESVITSLLTFLDADTSDIPQQVYMTVNESSKTRIPLLRNTLSIAKNTLDKNIFVRQAYKTLRLDDLGWKLVRLNSTASDKVHVNLETRKMLQGNFRDSIYALEELIDRSLKVWQMS